MRAPLRGSAALVRALLGLRGKQASTKGAMDGQARRVSQLDPNWKMAGAHTRSVRIRQSAMRRRCAAVLCVLLVVFAGLSMRSRAARANARSVAKRTRKCVVLDAGSSGTRVHVFTFRPAATAANAWFARRHGKGKAAPAPNDATTTLAATLDLVVPAPSKKQKPGLSSFVGRPADAAATLRPLLQFAESHVLPEERATTPVALFATAGLRAVPGEASAAILEACADVLTRSGFAIPSTVGTWATSNGASIISGELEGRWSWLAARYAAPRGAEAAAPPGDERARGAASATGLVAGSDGWLGLVEMGGASMQIVYPILADNAATPDPLDAAHGAFVRSYLGLGLEKAQTEGAELYASSEHAAGHDACTPPGYTGTGRPPALSALPAKGNFSHCLVHAATAVLRLDAGCGAGGVGGLRCGIRGEPTPDIARAPALGHGRVRPWAVLLTENLFYLAEFLELPVDASIDDVARAGERYCTTPWHVLFEKHVAPLSASNPGEVASMTRDLLKYCFESAYAVALLRDGLGLDPSARGVLIWSNDLGAYDIGGNWALGAALELAAGAPTGKVAASIPASDPLLRRPPPPPRSSWSWLYVAIVVVLVLCAVTAVRRANRRGGRSSVLPTTRAQSWVF